MAAATLLTALVFTMAARSDGAWCVCNSGTSDAVLQKTLDFACGAGADCGPIQPAGSCYNPNTVRAHCSYATNSYYQRKGQTQDACIFQNTAGLSSTDPSYSGCSFPATPSAASASSTPGQGTTGGLGPSDSSSNDSSVANSVLIVGMCSIFPTVFFSGIALLI